MHYNVLLLSKTAAGEVGIQPLPALLHLSLVLCRIRRLSGPDLVLSSSLQLPHFQSLLLLCSILFFQLNLLLYFFPLEILCFGSTSLNIAIYHSTIFST